MAVEKYMAEIDRFDNYGRFLKRICRILGANWSGTSQKLWHHQCSFILMYYSLVKYLVHFLALIVHPVSLVLFPGNSGQKVYLYMRLFFLKTQII